MRCDMCGRDCGDGKGNDVYEMKRLKPDTRSGLKKLVFDRNPNEDSDYDKMWVCSECSGKLKMQGWELNWRGKE